MPPSINMSRKTEAPQRSRRTPSPQPKSDISDFGQSKELPNSDKSEFGWGDGAHPFPQAAEFQLAALYRLVAWLSPSYPVGAFSYSGGLEWAIEAGDVRDAATLARWLTATIREGSGYGDAVLFVHAHRATTTGDDAALAAIAELGAAFTPSRERFLETTAQGRAFFDTTRAAWPCAALARLAAAWDGPLAYPVAVAVASAGHGIAIEPALAVYLQAIAANLVSAGMRLVPLGQTDGQRVIAELEPHIAATAELALACPLEEIASASFRADIAGMRHETQYTRLFRS
jgi:urease accessory protein